ncbi:type II CAAX prenyl endopeptidase Rce1 family protein [Desulfotomaculum nigrificans]|uniref:CPBP family glutamic-type intramembrane protease n=1 Tax=Desulfotomaculum nigrificans TaxID=1565 RepID=UPI0001FAE5A2|nr:CPBP family glutamic-type intramembrane protease [Desulfotomaculum nigrificans]
MTEKITPIKMVLKIICFFSFIVISGLIIGFLNTKYSIGLNKSDIELFWGSTIYLVSFLVFIPGLWKEFKKQLITANLLKAVLIPLIFIFTVDYISYIIRYIPLIFGYQAIEVAAGQHTRNYGYLSIWSLLFKGIFPAFNEEILFRFLPYNGLLLLVSFLYHERNNISEPNTKNIIFVLLYKFFNFLTILSKIIYISLFKEKDTFATCLWVLGFSFLFAMAHEPNIINFYLYFIPGVIFSVSFLKYGLLSSMICHAVSNYTSPLWNKLAILTLVHFLK